MTEIKVYQDDEDGLWVAEGEAADGVMVIMTGETQVDAIRNVRVLIGDDDMVGSEY